MDEAGDPTSKYYALREIIGEFLPLPNIPVPQKEPKMSLGAVRLQAVNILSSNTSRQHMGTAPVHSRSPMTFEALNQYSGLILYEANLPVFVRDPSTLKIDKIRDRAYVYVDKVKLLFYTKFSSATLNVFLNNFNEMKSDLHISHYSNMENSKFFLTRSDVSDFHRNFIARK